MATTRNSSTPRNSAPRPRHSDGLAGEGLLWAYGAAGRLAAPAAKLVLRRRERLGKEEGGRRGERFGWASKPRRPGPLIWVHASSIGETVAALPLAERLSALGLPLLLTTHARAAAELAQAQLGQGAAHQYCPLDTPASVGRFLDHWRPSLALFAEAELWPTTIHELRLRNVPLVLFSARISEGSFRVWQRCRSFASAVFGRVTLCLAQSAADAERLRALGAQSVKVCGNLKYDLPPPPADPASVNQIRERIGGRPVFLAASTHPGEEAAVLSAHSAIARRGTGLLTILAPRHPWRGEELAGEIGAWGLNGSRRSLGEPIGSATEIYLADTTGEMGLWYRVADVAFLGGSMVGRGGQNPIEPIKLGVPVLHGPGIANFQDVYDQLGSAGAAECVGDGERLAAAAARLLACPQERARRARLAQACLAPLTGALERTFEALQPYLAGLEAEDAAPRA